MNVTKNCQTLPSLFTDFMLHKFDSLNKQYISLRVNKTPLYSCLFCQKLSHPQLLKNP